MGPWRPSCCCSPSPRSPSRLGRQDRTPCPSSGGKPFIRYSILEIKCESTHLIYELSCSGKFRADPQLIHLWGCKLAFLIKFYMVTIVTFLQAGFSEIFVFQKFLYCADSPFTELVFLSLLAKYQHKCQSLFVWIRCSND